MAWLSFKIDKRLDLFFENHNSELKEVLPPEIEDDPSHYANFIKTYCTDEVERIIIAMALANYFKPELFDRFLIKNKSLGKNFTEFGGKTSDKTENIFIPTLRTVAFILFGDQIPDYFKLHFFLRTITFLNFKMLYCLISKPIFWKLLLFWAVNFFRKLLVVVNINPIIVLSFLQT